MEQHVSTLLIGHHQEDKLYYYSSMYGQENIKIKKNQRKYAICFWL